MKMRTMDMSIRHHPNSRRFTCDCGKLHEYWNDYVDAKGRRKPNHTIVCACGRKHRRY